MLSLIIWDTEQERGSCLARWTHVRGRLIMKKRPQGAIWCQKKGFCGEGSMASRA